MLLFHWLHYMLLFHWLYYMLLFHWLHSSPFTYDIHMEATRTLLILLSGQMFAATPATPSPFLHHVMATHMYVHDAPV